MKISPIKENGSVVAKLLYEKLTGTLKKPAIIAKGVKNPVIRKKPRKDLYPSGKKGFSSFLILVDNVSQDVCLVRVHKVYI